MTTIGHQVIRASAGTGKTFALSDRIVRLLGLGVDPETIVALTFTRKAAAEFVSEVFRKLASAARDGKMASDLARRVGLEGWASGDFARVLAETVAKMDRLQFGTLDSFFQRVVCAIPFELGLGGPVQTLDESGAAAAREEAIERLSRVGAEAKRAVIDAFREATWGAEEKQLLPRLLRFVEDCHALYLESPEPDAWGSASRIWPGGLPWRDPDGETERDLSAIVEWSERLDGRLGNAVAKFATAITEWQPGIDLPDDAVAAQLFAKMDGGSAPDEVELVYYGKPTPVPSPVAAAFHRIVQRVLASAVERALAAARGIFLLLASYDRAYEDYVRRSGRLGFGDVVDVLRRIDPTAWQPRLDARLSHWLFDEFQDTSEAQWAVLRSLVDEVFQDPSGTRSVFFVGDAKQSIYRWRGGEHRLLSDIEDAYGSVIARESLDRSFRSTTPVIELVNRFGDAVGGMQARIPSDAVEEWRRAWIPHTSALASVSGHARVAGVSDADSLVDEIFGKLMEIDPVGRGLTCAILTRGNVHASQIAAMLRERGFHDVAAETDVPVAMDHPLTRVLLAAVSVAAHPGDSAARGIVEMSPLAGWLESVGGWTEAQKVLLDGFTASGFESTLRQVVFATGCVPDDRFTSLRVGQFFDIARAFDRTGSRRPDDFLRFASEATRRDSASAGRVQVMTVHKAKGLGFDLVFLPVLDRTRIDAADTGPLVVGRGEGRDIEWVIGRPPAVVVDLDATLSMARDVARTDAAYESLCVLYVGLTRARFGLHVLVGDAPKESGGPISPVGLVRECVAAGAESGLLWECGDPEWYRLVEQTPVDMRPAIVPAEWSEWTPAPTFVPLRPSGRDSSAPVALRDRNSGGLSGSEVHAAFATIDRLTDEGLLRPAGVSEGAWKIVRECLDVPEIAELFAPGPETVWRERAFDVVDGGLWISGVFDRVVVGDGGVTLVDFKTDRAEPAVVLARHREQMRLYRTALKKLTGIDEVRAVIVHTASQRVLDLPVE